MTTIGNIGIGLLILLIVWIVTLFVFVIGVKIQSNISWIALCSATALTVLLLIIPTEKQHKEPISQTGIFKKDYSIIHKNILLGFLVLSAVTGFGIFFVSHCIEPVRPKPIKSYYAQ